MAVGGLEQPPRDGAPLPHLAQHAVVNPVPQAWHGAEDRRPQQQHVVEQRLHVPGEEADRGAAVREPEHRHALVDVRERQVRDVHVARRGAQDAEGPRGVGDEVGVRQHRALGHARRARGVADRRDVLGARRAVLDPAQVLPARRGELVDGDDARVGGPRGRRVRDAAGASP